MPEITFQHVEIPELISRVMELHQDGYRLVQMHCTRLKSEDAGSADMEVTYTFDRDYQVQNLRITLNSEQAIPSVSAIFPAAFLYENEIHDLFGITVSRMSIDYGGNLYKTAVPTPFNQKTEGTGGNG